MFNSIIKVEISKAKLLGIIIFFSVFIKINAQVSAYTFTSSTGVSLENMSSGTTQLISSGNDDVSSSLTSIGFNFLFNCVNYTQFSVNSNGLMALGTSVSTAYSNQLTSSSDNPKIVAYWDDLATGSNGKVHYKLFGSSPNRYLVIEWLVTVPYSTSSPYNGTFQVILYETSNNIKFIYGTVPSGSSFSSGLAASSTDYMGVNVSANTTFTTGTNDSQTTAIASGKAYTFAPGSVPSAPGCASALSPANGATGISKCAPTLTWTAPASAGCNAATSYDIYFGTSSTPAYYGSSTTNSIDLGILSASTTYYWKVVPSNSSGSATGCTTQSFTTNSTACTVSPAGISSSLAFWVKANSIASGPSNNNTIAIWDDKSGGARNATQSTNANKPIYKDNATDNINYNPIINLDGTDDYMDITSNGVLPIGNNNYAVYAVIAPDNTNTDSDPGKFFFSGDPGANNFCSFDVRGPGNINDSWNQNDLITSSQWSNTESLLGTFNYNGSQRAMYKNGSLIGTLNTSTNRTSTNTNSAIGLQSAANIEYYGGKIAEIISYKDKSHGSSNRETIESYLAIKYSFTLPHHYYASTGTNIYSVSSPYNNNIIGIGSDNSNSALIQKQSHTTDDTVRIYKGTLSSTNNANAATFSSDISYVVMGANTGKLSNSAAASAESPVSCGLYSRLEREWKVTSTNFAETFNLNIKLNAGAVTSSVTVADLRFLVDDDGNFANGGTTCYYNGDGTGITISYSNPVITITGIANTHIPYNSTRYITIGSVNRLTPLPISLINFSAVCQESGILVSWSTASETDNKRFELERSTDGVNYTIIASLNGHGTTQEQNNYSYLDKSSIKQHYYYRLKQIDSDNKASYNYVLTESNNYCNTKEVELLVFPNPANESIYVKSTSDKPVMIEVINDCGQLVYKSDKNILSQEQVEITTSHLASGIYAVRVIGDFKTVVKKITISH